MSGRIVSRFILVCDGCQAEFGQYPSATEARAAAYGQGWRFPAKVTAHGTPSSRAADVCPKCLPTWKPTVSRNRSPKERP